jgi:hypothetical protein
MTRLLVGLTGGLYRFDLDAGGSPRPVLLGLQPMAFAMDPGEPARLYCATYNRGLWRSEDAGQTWLPVGIPQGFFRGPAGGAIQPRETTFVSVDPVPQTDGRHAVWVSSSSSVSDATIAFPPSSADPSSPWDLTGSGAVSNRLAALGCSVFAGTGASGATAGLLEFPAGSFFVIWLPDFFLASARAALEASSISALARSREFFSSRWLETK